MAKQARLGDQEEYPLTMAMSFGGGRFDLGITRRQMMSESRIGECLPAWAARSEVVVRTVRVRTADAAAEYKI